jgi:hypothetical protein
MDKLLAAKSTANGVGPAEFQFARQFGGTLFSTSMLSDDGAQTFGARGMFKGLKTDNLRAATADISTAELKRILQDAYFVQTPDPVTTEAVNGRPVEVLKVVGTDRSSPVASIAMGGAFQQSALTDESRFSTNLHTLALVMHRLEGKRSPIAPADYGTGIGTI